MSPQVIKIVFKKETGISLGLQGWNKIISYLWWLPLRTITIEGNIKRIIMKQ